MSDSYFGSNNRLKRRSGRKTETYNYSRYSVEERAKNNFIVGLIIVLVISIGYGLYELYLYLFNP